MTRDFTSHSADDTVELGRQLAPLLKGAHLVLLRGDLGAGKTQLVKGIASGLGIAQEVTSPTFTLTNPTRSNCIRRSMRKTIKNS